MRPGPGWGLGVAIGATVILLSSCGSTSSTNTSAGGTTTSSPSTTSPTTSTSPSAPSGPPTCQAAQLQASRLSSGAAAGNIVNTYGLRNVSGGTCTLFGYPGLQMIDASGRTLPTQVSRGGSYTFGSETPAPVMLPAQGVASFYLGYSDVPTGGGTSCPQSARLEITPPNDTSSITITDQIAPCGNGAVTVSPVHSGTAPPP